MVTLQDVSTLWGVPIQGAPVGVVFDPSSNILIDDCIKELLGVWPSDVQTNHGKSKFHTQMTKIRAHFSAGMSAESTALDIKR